MGVPAADPAGIDDPISVECVCVCDTPASGHCFGLKTLACPAHRCALGFVMVIGRPSAGDACSIAVFLSRRRHNNL